MLQCLSRGLASVARATKDQHRFAFRVILDLDVQARIVDLVGGPLTNIVPMNEALERDRPEFFVKLLSARTTDTHSVSESIRFGCRL
jgi:hypothetical protein